ncbi:ATP-binding protein [Sporolactobacillus sp. STCC-11]|uniref:sensor histidine kinase n=1 Tax=Sporolactobacillus caesalpiniae TaxID=3230362 RepID=UPI00339AE10C
MTAKSINLWKRWLLLGCLCASLPASIVLLMVRETSGNPVFNYGLPYVSFLFCFGLGIYFWSLNQSEKGEQRLVIFLTVLSLLWLTGSAGRTDFERLVCRDLYLIIYLTSLVLSMRVLKKFFSYWSLVWVSARTEIIGAACAALTLISVIAGQCVGLAGAWLLAIVVIAALMLFIIICAIRALRRYDDAAYTPMLQVVTIGLLFAFIPNLILSLVPSLVQNELVVHLRLDIFLLIWPLLLSYLINSNRFMDVSFVVTHVAYCALIAAPLAVLLGVLFHVVAEWNMVAYARSDGYRFMIAAFVALFVIFYIKQYLDYALRKRLYPKQQDVETSLNRFLQWIKPDSDLSDVGRIIKREMEACLPVEQVGLSRIGQEERSMSLHVEKAYQESERDLNQSQDELGKLFMTLDGFRIILSKSAHGKIVIDGKWSMPRRRLNPDERVWLATLINYAQMVIENLSNTKEMMEKLEETSLQAVSVPLTIKKMMLRISERERWKLSRKLHDQNMQDQLDIARQLDAWSTHAEDPETKALMVKFREQVLDSVYVLRQVINDLHPEFIYRTGLRKALMELFDKVNLRADFTLQATIDEHLEGFQREWEIAVYRVIQELLNNARKHSHARQVHLSLEKENGQFTLTYADDGIGLDVSKIGQSFGTMGFPGMIGRVEGLGGRFNICSKKGNGVEITIQWTNNEAYSG